MPHTKQTYRQTVYITNTLSSLAEVSVRPGNLERYTVTPASFQLKPNESIAVEVKLRILRFVRTPRTEQQGHRDIFHIKVLPSVPHASLHPRHSLPCPVTRHATQSAFFDQKFYSTFFLDGERGVSDALGRSEVGAVRFASMDCSRCISDYLPLCLRQGRTGSRQSSPFASPSRSSRSMPSPDQSPTGSPRQPSKSLMPSLDLPAKAGNTRVSVPPLQRHLTTQTRQDEGAGTSKPMRDAWMRYQGEAEDAPTTTGASQGPARRVHELEAENWKLQQQLEELDLDYRGVTVQMHAATRLADELQKENPVVKQAVESAVAVERAAQELRNQKASRPSCRGQMPSCSPLPQVIFFACQWSAFRCWSSFPRKMRQ